MVLVEDCCGAPLPGEHESAVRNIATYFGLVAESRAVLSVLQDPAWATKGRSLYFKLVEGLRREELLYGHPSSRQALLEGILAHGFDRLSVLLYAVGPPVLAHDAPRLLHVPREPRQGGMEREGVLEALHGYFLRGGHGLVEGHGNPRILLVQGPLYDHGVHDGEDPRLLVVSFFRLHVEEVRHVGRALGKARGVPPREKGVDLARVEHVGEGAVRRYRLVVHVRGELEPELLLPPRQLYASAPPVYLPRVDPVLVLEYAPEPQGCRDLVLREAHGLFPEVFGTGYPLVHIDEHAGVAEEPRR